MIYVIRSSEQNAARGNDMETRALLHLLNFRDELGEIEGFAIDFFNDVTGIDSMALHLYDIQSKASISGAKDIGEELVTLFKNYVSEFKDFFIEEVLFLGGVRKNVFEDEELSEFKFADLRLEARQIIKQSLREECLKKGYINNEDVTEENLDGFLQNVVFVVAKDTIEEYVAPLVRSSKAIVPTSNDLNAIFNEIRKAQVGIKTRTKVEGVEIEHPYEAYNYSRVLKRSDIELLVINRLINRNPLEAGIPTCFIPIYNKLQANSPEDVDDKIEECQNSLARQMFASSEATAFWGLLNAIVSGIDGNPSADVESIYQTIDPAISRACKFLDVLSVQYFISIVKDGLK